MPCGWKKESYRHSLASRGISSIHETTLVNQSMINTRNQELVEKILREGFGFKELKQDLDFVVLHEQARSGKEAWKSGTINHFKNKLRQMHQTLMYLEDQHLITKESSWVVRKKIIELETALQYSFKDFKNIVRNASTLGLDQAVEMSMKQAFHSEGQPKPLPLQPGFVNMDIKDEKDATKHYRLMSAKLKRTHPAYAEVLEEMSEDESRHARYLQAMKSSKKVDIRTVVTDDSKNIVEELHDRKMLNERQKATLGHLIDREVSRMPPEKLKAKGLAISLVGSLLGPLLGGMLSAGSQSQSSSNKKGGK